MNGTLLGILNYTAAFITINPWICELTFKLSSQWSGFSPDNS